MRVKDLVHQLRNHEPDFPIRVLVSDSVQLEDGDLLEINQVRFLAGGIVIEVETDTD